MALKKKRRTLFGNVSLIQFISISALKSSIFSINVKITAPLNVCTCYTVYNTSKEFKFINKSCQILSMLGTSTLTTTVGRIWTFSCRNLLKNLWVVFFKSAENQAWNRFIASVLPLPVQLWYSTERYRNKNIYHQMGQGTSRNSYKWYMYQNKYVTSGYRQKMVHF